MTAPLKRNGKLVTTIVRGCESKVRYSDEFGAQAAGMMYQEKNGKRLFVYPCNICRGWHITMKIGKFSDIVSDLEFTDPKDAGESLTHQMNDQLF